MLNIKNPQYFFQNIYKKIIYLGGGKNQIQIREQLLKSYDKNIYNLSQLTKFQNIINSIDIFQKIIYMIKNNYLNKDFKTESKMIQQIYKLLIIIHL